MPLDQFSSNIDGGFRRHGGRLPLSTVTWERNSNFSPQTHKISQLFKKQNNKIQIIKSLIDQNSQQIKPTELKDMTWTNL